MICTGFIIRTRNHQVFWQRQQLLWQCAANARTKTQSKLKLCVTQLSTNQVCDVKYAFNTTAVAVDISARQTWTEHLYITQCTGSVMIPVSFSQGDASKTSPKPVGKLLKEHRHHPHTLLHMHAHLCTHTRARTRTHARTHARTLTWCFAASPRTSA